jgi:hypothetical protein
MKRDLFRASACGILAVFAIPGAFAQDPAAAGLKAYHVTITNLTSGQVFSPPALVMHSDDVALFELGEPALAAVATIAEDGDTLPLADLAALYPELAEVVQAQDPIPPGATAEYTLTSSLGFDLLSVIGMLVNTNDAFFAVDAARFPGREGVERTFTTVAYDAGTEANNESCRYIPGPACSSETGNERSTEDAEGFVHVHSGIHGIADLESSVYDWRNPVAAIRIERID